LLLEPVETTQQVVKPAALTMEMLYEVVHAEQAVAIAQAELDNAKEMLENRTHELSALKAKYNIQ
jgi:hypothetical protein